MEEFVVGYNPLPAAERVAHYRQAVRSRLVWLGVGLVVVVAIYLWQRDILDLMTTVLLFVAGLGFSVMWVLLSAIQWMVARRQLSRVNTVQGVALRIREEGIDIGDQQLTWADVARVHTAKGPLGIGLLLAVTDTQGQTTSVPLTYLDSMPGTLDSAIRAYSGGRRWLDTSGLGN